MRFLILFSSAILVLTSCKSDDSVLQEENKFLPNTQVNIRLNLDLPLYNNLKFPGNTFIIEDRGVTGIYISNLNNTIYNAFELTDPNHALSDCSRLVVEGINATCSCDDEFVYNLLDGQRDDKRGFALRRYRAVREGNTLFITN